MSGCLTGWSALQSENGFVQYNCNLSEAVTMKNIEMNKSNEIKVLNNLNKCECHLPLPFQMIKQGLMESVG